MARNDFRGGAAKCTLHSDILADELAIVVDGDVSGWPTGASGRNFVMVLERGTAKMEKILCSALTSTTLTVVSRGYDGTSAKTHSSGTNIEHGFGATVLDDYGRHVYDTASDDHTQYIRVNGSRAFSALTSIAGTPVSVGTANASGSALTLARSDHVHDLADGSLDHAALFGAGVVNETALNASVAGAALTGGGGSPLAVAVDNATIEVSSDAIRVKAGAAIVPGALAQSPVKPLQVATTGGPTSGTSELVIATLNIPSQTYAYVLECAAFWTAHNSVDLDYFDFRIRVDTVEKGITTMRHVGGTNIRFGYSIPTTEAVSIAAATACTVTATIQRASGTGILTEHHAGFLTGRLYF